jgi:hypothetical protein
MLKCPKQVIETQGSPTGAFTTGRHPYRKNLLTPKQKLDWIQDSRNPGYH